MDFTERSTRVYRTKQLYTKEELAARESLCVHEQPAFCAAACPLRLDARELLGHAAKGELAQARAMLERATPFPGILAAGCEAPCRAVCRLNEIPGGQSVDIPAVERAAMRHGAARTGRGLLKFKKKKTSAVFGAELFTLIVAGELAAKSYPTKFFVAEGSAEELMDKCAQFLSPEDRAAEIKRLAAMDIELEYGSELTPELVRGAGADIVCVSREVLALLDKSAAPDEVTLWCESLGVLARAGENGGVISAFYDARRAGVSADRLAQDMSPDTMRGEEGPVESRLYTDLSEAKPASSVPEGGGYTPEQAAAEAARCIQCRCEECVKGCAWLRHYDKFPRIMTREIYNNVGIIMGDHMMNGAINSCALCGQCSVTCPNGYDMAEICLSARRNMVATGKMSLAVHEFALYDQIFSNTEAFLCRSEPGYETSKYVFFPGCQAGAIAPEAVYRAYADLRARLSGGVGILLGCCGIISNWAGREELFNETRETLKAELKKLGDPVIITACPSCTRTLREAGVGECKPVWDVLLELGLPEDAPKAVGEAVIHDACGARGDAGTQSAVRELVARLGCGITEPEHSGDRAPCCGYGGLAGYAKPEVAADYTKAALSGCEGLQLTYCMGCRDRYARQGAESAHILELIYSAPAGDPPGISEKRKNRLTLKQRLLRDIWKEDTHMAPRGYKIEYTPEVKELMEQRMVLESDIETVMQAYREGGEAIYEADTGLRITRYRLGNVTFWVKFTEDAEGYVIHSAYSHRMTVETR